VPYATKNNVKLPEIIMEINDLRGFSPVFSEASTYAEVAADRLRFMPPFGLV
jgi:hypothetical protein